MPDAVCENSGEKLSRGGRAEAPRLRVLLSAYACEPGKGSEPGVGWNWVKQLARHEDVWVLTRSNNRGAIEQALRSEPRSAETHNNLGIALANQGRLTEATAQFTEALRLQPDLADAHRNLARARQTPP